MKFFSSSALASAVCLTVCLGVSAGQIVLARASIVADTLVVSTEARSLQPGELIVVTVTTDADLTRLNVIAFGKTIPAFKTTGGWEALVGIDLDQKPGTYVLKVDARSAAGVTSLSGTKSLVVSRKQFQPRTLRVAPDFVNPTAEQLERIARDQKLLADVFSHPAPTRLWQMPFARPVPQATNSAFGSRSVFNGVPGSPHAGTDFLSPAGTPVHAPNAGRVVVARDLFYSGNTVIIDHGLGVFSTLMHLSRIDVGEGDTVDVDHVIGLVGATGRVTGPHLHWALRVNDARVDPLAALALLGR